MKDYKKILTQKQKKLKKIEEKGIYNRDFIKQQEREIGDVLLEAIETNELLKNSVWNISTNLGFGRHYGDSSYEALSVGETSLRRDLYLNPLESLTTILPSSGSFKIYMKFLNVDVVLHVSCWNIEEPYENLEGMEIHSEGTIFFTYDKEYPQTTMDNELSMKMILALVDKFGMKISSESLDLIKGFIDNMNEAADKMISDIERRL
jgi:hypothetical protein